MSNPNIITLELNDHDKAHLAGITEGFPNDLSRGKEGDAADWIQTRLGASSLRLTPQLRELNDSFSVGADAVHITGLPTYDLPPTPDAYQTVEDAVVYNFDLPHFALSGLVGAVYGSRHVRGGRIVADIFPRLGFETKQDSAFGSKQDFDFHADGVVQPDTAPDVFALHCLRNAEQVPTFFSVVSAADFDPVSYYALSQPVYKIIYEVGNEEDILENVPIIEENEKGRLRLNYYGSAKVICDAPTSERENFTTALRAFDEALQSSAHSITLQPGELLFVDNKHALHGRRAFDGPPIAASDRRWLRRVFIARDPLLIDQVMRSGNRILTSQHKQPYVA